MLDDEREGKLQRPSQPASQTARNEPERKRGRAVGGQLFNPVPSVHQPEPLRIHAAIMMMPCRSTAGDGDDDDARTPTKKRRTLGRQVPCRDQDRKVKRRREGEKGLNGKREGGPGTLSGGPDRTGQGRTGVI